MKLTSKLLRYIKVGDYLRVRDVPVNQKNTKLASLLRIAKTEGIDPVVEVTGLRPWTNGIMFRGVGQHLEHIVVNDLWSSRLETIPDSDADLRLKERLDNSPNIQPLPNNQKSQPSPADNERQRELQFFFGNTWANSGLKDE